MTKVHQLFPQQRPPKLSRRRKKLAKKAAALNALNQYRHFRLIGKNIVPIDAIQITDSDMRTIRCDKIGAIRVSTVFLCINHNYFAGRPLVFETMTFPLDGNEALLRYSSYKAAVKGHKRVVAAVRKRQEAWQELQSKQQLKGGRSETE